MYALQVSQTIDYLEEKFSGSGLLSTDNTTVIGHSFGGYVALRAACHERRISRIALLSAYFEQFLELNVMDTYDIMRYLNSLPDADKPALHVQRFTQTNRGCPDNDPECDPIPVVDGTLFLTNLSEDPWEPILCDGMDCGERGGTFYHYTLYSGPKEDGIRNNPFLTHGEGDLEAGHPEAIRHLDNFFDQFPVAVPAGNGSVSLVETRSTPGFDPPVFFMDPRPAD
jgi:pimeloyl-ACP methyl ester carboxylesterase